MNGSRCQSTPIVKYGKTHYGKPRFKCQTCQRQFVEAPTRQPIAQTTRELIDKLLLRMSLLREPQIRSNTKTGRRCPKNQVG